MGSAPMRRAARAWPAPEVLVLAPRYPPPASQRMAGEDGFRAGPTSLVDFAPVLVRTHGRLVVLVEMQLGKRLVGRLHLAVVQHHAGKEDGPLAAAVQAAVSRPAATRPGQSPEVNPGLDEVGEQRLFLFR